MNARDDKKMDQTATQVDARMATELVPKPDAVKKAEILVMSPRTPGYPAFELPEEGVVGVGRNSKIVNMVLNDMSVSRHHANLQVAHRKLYLTDTGTLNGTFVNNRRIATIAEVRVNDIVKFGNITYQLVLETR